MMLFFGLVFFRWFPGNFSADALENNHKLEVIMFLLLLLNKQTLMKLKLQLSEKIDFLVLEERAKAGFKCQVKLILSQHSKCAKGNSERQRQCGFK